MNIIDYVTFAVHLSAIRHNKSVVTVPFVRYVQVYFKNFFIKTGYRPT